MLDLCAAFASFPVLETERLVLRAPVLADAPAIFRIMSDPRVMRYFGAPPMTSLEAAEQRIAGLAADFAALRGIRWAIVPRAGGELIGTCGFWRLIKEHARAEIGYELDPAHWGQGLMPEAVGAALDFGFGPMGLHSVEAQIDPANASSRRVLEKLGFVQEGYFRESYYDPNAGRFTDTAVFSLLRSDWVARRHGASTAS